MRGRAATLEPLHELPALRNDIGENCSLSSRLSTVSLSGTYLSLVSPISSACIGGRYTSASAGAARAGRAGEAGRPIETGGGARGGGARLHVERRQQLADERGRVLALVEHEPHRGLGLPRRERSRAPRRARAAARARARAWSRKRRDAGPRAQAEILEQPAARPQL